MGKRLVGEAEDMVKLRKKADKFFRYICDHVPEGRERTIAIVRLEECVFWCNAALRAVEIEENEDG